MGPQQVIEFWFEEIEPKWWWKKSEEFDQTIRRRFAGIHKAAVVCELYEWRATPSGRLAEIIVLDQFSRNLFRGTPASFANDPLALCLTQEAISAGVDQELEPQQRCFFYLPYVHSESRRIHQVAPSLFTDPALKRNLEFELRHKEIIDRFGRYPHRNEILGRESRTEELEFLKQPGSFF